MSNAYIAKYRELCGGSRMLGCLIGLNICVSIIAVCVMTANSAAGEAVKSILVLPSAWGAYITRPWTLLTYMVTQFSLLHLLVNVLWLFWFGRLVLAEVSDRQLGLCYLIGGMSGGVGYLLTSSFGGDAGQYLCGSSAAVMGVMCMAGVLLGNIRLRFMLIGTVKVKWVALVCVVLTLLGTRGTTAVTVAHLGGVAGGIIFAFGLRGLKLPSGRSADMQEIIGKVRSRMPKRERKRKPENVAKAMRGRLNDHARLDELLDKIRVSGYSSLSDIERRELDALSKRL